MGTRQSKWGGDFFSNNHVIWELANAVNRSNFVNFLQSIWWTDGNISFSFRLSIKPPLARNHAINGTMMKEKILFASHPTMDSVFDNEPSFDLSSISYLNHQAKRLEDFSILETPNPKQSSSVIGDRHNGRDDRQTARERAASRNTVSTDHSPERPVSCWLIKLQTIIPCH